MGDFCQYRGQEYTAQWKSIRERANNDSNHETGYPHYDKPTRTIKRNTIYYFTGIH